MKKTKKVITRKEYMDGKATFREYNAQFVTEALKARVLSTITKDRLLRSKDEHLNDIPMKLWDNMAGASCRGSEVIWFNPHAITPLMAFPFKEAGDGYSLAGAVCVLKEAGKQLIEELKA